LDVASGDCLFDFGAGEGLGDAGAAGWPMACISGVSRPGWSMTIDRLAAIARGVRLILMNDVT
jgi:hypothetical protein